MSVFKCHTYREFLQQKIAENEGVKGYKGKLAAAAQCHHTYLSQVLTASSQLTPDHASGLCIFWSLSDQETDYFITLVNLDRASTPQLKKHLKQRLTALREQSLDMRQRLKSSKQIGEELSADYYSTWQASAIHVLASVPGYDTVDTISKRLQIPAVKTQSILLSLEKSGILKLEKGKWRVSEKDIHLSKASRFINAHHANWRQKLSLLHQEGSLQGIHYTGIHALSRADIEGLKELILECIQQARAIVAPSPEEDIVCFTCDFFNL